MRWWLVGLAAAAMVGGALVLLQGDADAPPTAHALVAQCGPDLDCHGAALEAILVDHGQQTAFQRLAEVIVLGNLHGHDHELAHRLGRLAYREAASAEAAMGGCPPTMGAGCMHGVLEGYITEFGPDAPLHELCGVSQARTVHQCWHGVGHGLLMIHKYDWRVAGEPCRHGPDFDSRVACHSGIFMELHMGSPTAMPEFAGNLPTDPKDRYDADDLHYPCNEVTGTEALVGCWNFQPWVIRTLTDGDWFRAFWTCSEAGIYDLACERGMGQVAATEARRSEVDAMDICAVAGESEATSNCLWGVVNEVITHAGTIDAGIDFCMAIDEDRGDECFVRVGQMHAAWQGDAAVRWATCHRVPEAWRPLCAAADGGTGQPS